MSQCIVHWLLFICTEGGGKCVRLPPPSTALETVESGRKKKKKKTHCHTAAPECVSKTPLSCVPLLQRSWWAAMLPGRTFGCCNIILR